jgi:hypothetical protein
MKIGVAAPDVSKSKRLVGADASKVTRCREAACHRRPLLTGSRTSPCALKPDAGKSRIGERQPSGTYRDGQAPANCRR